MFPPEVQIKFASEHSPTGRDVLGAIVVAGQQLNAESRVLLSFDSPGLWEVFPVRNGFVTAREVGDGQEFTINYRIGVDEDKNLLIKPFPPGILTMTSTVVGLEIAGHPLNANPIRDYDDVERASHDLAAGLLGPLAGFGPQLIGVGE